MKHIYKKYGLSLKGVAPFFDPSKEETAELESHNKGQKKEIRRKSKKKLNR
jgi:hypothetical protein